MATGLSKKELSGLDRDAAELQAALEELIRVYRFRDRKCICRHDVSVTQCEALRALHRGLSMTLNQLATELYLDDSTTSRVVDSLDRKGYTTRSQDPNDARAVRVELTVEGRNLYGLIEEELLSEQKALLREFDPEVRQATTRLIARLAREAVARVSRSDGRCC